MLIHVKSSLCLNWTKLLRSLVLVAVLLVLPLTSFAKDANLRAAKVQGALGKRYSKHYLALEPTQRDAIVTVTLHIEPQDEQHVANKVNLLLLTEDGLRRVQAGDKPDDVAFATGNPTIIEEDAPFKLIFNKTAEFKASGRGIYTVVVYSRASIPTSYTLSAENAEIIDGSNQVASAQ